MGSIRKILDFISARFKTDVRYLIKGSFWLNMSRVITIGGGMVLTLVFANMLSQETYGLYKYVISIAGFVSAFSLTGIGAALVNSVARGDDPVIRKMFWHGMKWSLIGSVMALIAAGYYFFKGNEVLGVSLLAIAFYNTFTSTGIYKAYLQGKRDFRTLAMYNIPRSLIPIAIMIATVFISDNVVYVILAYFISNTIASWLCYEYTLRRYNIGHEATSEASTLTYAKHSSVMSFISMVAGQLDSLLLWHFAGPAQVAIYAFATTPVKELKGLQENIFSLLTPKMAMRPEHEVRASLGFRTRQLFYVIVPVVVVYILIAPFLFKIFFPQYVSAILYSQIFALILLMQPRGLIDTAITAQEKVGKRYASIVSLNLSRIVFMCALVPFYGIMGAIVAAILSEAVNFIILGYLVNKK